MCFGTEDEEVEIHNVPPQGVLASCVPLAPASMCVRVCVYVRFTDRNPKIVSASACGTQCMGTQ